MNERKPYVKPLGLALSLIPVALFIVIFILSSDIRGYKKLLDDYYGAIQREDASALAACYEQGAPDIQALLVTLSADENAGYDTEEYKNLLVRHSVQASEKQASSDYTLTVEVLVSAEEHSNRTTQELQVKKTGGGWKIAG